MRSVLVGRVGWAITVCLALAAAACAQAGHPALGYSTLRYVNTHAYATDASGNAYFWDSDQHKIVRLAPDGSVSLSFSPVLPVNSLAADASGNIYATLNCPTVNGPCAVSTKTFGTATVTGSSVSLLAKYDATGKQLYVDQMGGGSFSKIVPDASGNVYVSGLGGCDIPTTPGAYQSDCPPSQFGLTPQTGFAAKLDPDGQTLLYCTHLHGSWAGERPDLDAAGIDAAGDLVLTGYYFHGWPATAGAFETTAENLTSIIAKLNPTGTGLVYSTFLNDAVIYAVAVNAAGEVFLAGTPGAGFPTTPGALLTTAPSFTMGNLGFAMKLNAVGSALVYSTYLDFFQGGAVYALALDRDGDAVVGGYTVRTGVPTVNGIQLDLNDNSAGTSLGKSAVDFGDGAIVMVNPQGSAILFSTYLGGIGGDQIFSMGVADDGSIDVFGDAGFSYFPALSAVLGGPDSCCVGKQFTAKIVSSGGAVPVFRPGSVQNYAPGFNLFSFAYVQVGTSAAQTVVLENYGGASFNIGSITLNDPQFTQTNNCPATMAIGAQCSIIVTFSPKGPGRFDPLLTVKDPAGSVLRTQALDGYAIGPDFAISTASGSSTTATIAAGASTSYALALMPSNGFSGTVTLSCSGAPAGASCAVNSASVNVSGTAGTPFTVSVTTTARTALASVWPRANGTLGWMIALLFGGMFSVWFAAHRRALAKIPAQAKTGLGRGTRNIPTQAKRGLGWGTRGILFALAFVVMIGMGGCGGGTSSTPKTSVQSGTPAGTYTIVVSATSGSTTHTQNLTLVVQ